MTGATHRRRWPWILGGILLFFVLVLVAARIALTPLAARMLRDKLNAQPGLHADFKALSLSVLGLGAQLEGLALHIDPPGGTPVVATVETIDGHLHWADLLRFHLVAMASAENIKATAVIETPEE